MNQAVSFLRSRPEGRSRFFANLCTSLETNHKRFLCFLHLRCPSSTKRYKWRTEIFKILAASVEDRESSSFTYRSYLWGEPPMRRFIVSAWKPRLFGGFSNMTSICENRGFAITGASPIVISYHF